MEIRLTQFSHGSGCGCKVAPAVLEEILKDSGPAFLSKKLLVGNETKDDAAVYDMGNGSALISTVDFFTPIVNNPFDYGRIAAANALSDVYAMGGKPFMAIAILGLPVEKIPAEIAKKIIAGARAMCMKAEVVLAGGHTIDAPEPFFGLSVNGSVEIKNLKKNSTAQQDDLLYLTKPIGTGIIGTALKRELLNEDEIQEAVDQMCSLNQFGLEAGRQGFVHAMTDVTGFGLLGHLLEMCEGSGLSAQLEYAKVPLMKHAKELTAKFIYADNTMRNWKSYESKVQGISGESLLTLCDPQTNGGLLLAVAKENEDDFKTMALVNGLVLQSIGRMASRKAAVVEII